MTEIIPDPTNEQIMAAQIDLITRWRRAARRGPDTLYDAVELMAEHLAGRGDDMGIIARWDALLTKIKGD